MSKTIIISVTTIICTLLVCFAIVYCSEMNRYVNFNGFDTAILDKYTGKVYRYTQWKITTYDFKNCTIISEDDETEKMTLEEFKQKYKIDTNEKPTLEELKLEYYNNQNNT